MKLVNVYQDRDNAAFALEAEDYFRKHPECFTYARGEPTADEPLAIRWNCATVCVLYPRDEPLLYPTDSRGDMPRLTPTE